MIRGEDLENRPRPAHITEAEAELLGEKSRIPGRWVDAADIFPDDVLLLRDGREATVWNVEFYGQPQTTYNFAVDDLHSYAVGNLGVLVHNNCGTGAKRGPKTDPNAPHNAMIRQIGTEIENTPGYKVLAGGGLEPEKLISTPNGIKSGRRPDILYRTPSGALRGINVGRINAAGLPVRREREAIADLLSENILTMFIAY